MTKVMGEINIHTKVLMSHVFFGPSIQTDFVLIWTPNCCHCTSSFASEARGHFNVNILYVVFGICWDKKSLPFKLYNKLIPAAQNQRVLTRVLSRESRFEADPLEHKHLESLLIQNRLQMAGELRDSFETFWIYLHSCLST